MRAHALGVERNSVYEGDRALRAGAGSRRRSSNWHSAFADDALCQSADGGKSCALDSALQRMLVAPERAVREV
jgi:hypothetical protein